VVEAGANIGAHTVFLGRDICPDGRVYAFEPRRLIFQMLCANLALNSVGNVHAHHQALGAARGVVHEGALPREASNFGAFALGSLPGEAESFAVAPLDELLAALPRIALLKADVEGHELPVLQGAAGLIARDRPLLYLENDRPDLSEALIRHVMDLGYALWWHIVPLFRPDNAAGTTVNIFGDVHSFNMFCAPREIGASVQGLPPVVDPAAHPLRR
jgi:FkbM family methyltransferase